jgi:hypothetical protein
MEGKVDIKPDQSDIDSLKLNHRLQQLEFYFSGTLYMKKKIYYIPD